MHIAIEKARKAAGISSLRKNYPEDPKQRGCGYWAGFICVVGDQLASQDAEIMRLANVAAKLSEDNASLERKLGKAKDAKVANGVEALGLSEGWQLEKREQVLAKIAN